MAVSAAAVPRMPLDGTQQHSVGGGGNGDDGGSQ